ncbi:30S ribosomal protein S2 [Gillisia limnaea]|uniref:Small ribosomal subunit protein uS2 n=1 Tax=Gillisia limnaea (strain DSM 15749 / LMG 21470 / R-8282) TaxID=865937 RepID=H2BY44_GILLR|nr:30S ribosomal protein S2 [Gillisia limnaea]EHQ03250.1 SSU ribosomal protein S2P [Gillisia limnaea DSM 15749]
MANKVEVKDLLDAGVHFGHLTRRWNPNMAPYIYMERNGIHIINLYKSAAKMEEAGEALKKIAASGRKILFVATKKQAKEIVADQALRANMPYITERWPGGMLTNFITIRKAVKKMSSIDRMKKDGTFNTLSKKERLQVDRLRAKLEKNLGSISEMSRLPAALFVVDITREHIAVKEAQKLNIPIFAMVDTNSDPREVEYVIPSNDDASKSIDKVVSYLAESIIEGLSERKSGKDDNEEAGDKPARTKAPKAKKTTEEKVTTEAPAKAPEAKKATEEKATAEVPSTDPEDKKAMKEAKEEVKLESKEETLEKAKPSTEEKEEEK